MVKRITVCIWNLTFFLDRSIMNNVQNREVISINTAVISKEEILHVCRELIREKGWESVNIRAVAGACGISVGSVYNYFRSKSDLIAAAVESVWCDIFHFSEEKAAFQSFAACVAWVFESMRKGDEKYPGFFTWHSMGFVGEDRSNGRQLMEQSWSHMKAGLYGALMSDENVREGAFDESFTPEKFIEIIFSLIISSLLRRSYDCNTIQEMIGRIIYDR